LLLLTGATNVLVLHYTPTRPNLEINTRRQSTAKPLLDWFVGSLSSWVALGDELVQGQYGR